CAACLIVRKGRGRPQGKFSGGCRGVSSRRSAVSSQGSQSQCPRPASDDRTHGPPRALDSSCRLAYCQRKSASCEWPMPLQFKCPECHANLKLANDALAGRKIKCPKCAAVVRVTTEAFVDLEGAPTAQGTRREFDDEPRSEDENRIRKK